MSAFSQISKWDGSVQRWTRGNGSENNPYFIDSASQLAYLAQSVNAGIIYADTFFELTTNIDLDSLNWTPIGYTANEFYIGNFNGNNYSIYNLHCKDTSYRFGIVYSGLFGYVLDAKISNVNIKGNTVILSSFSTSYNFYAGGIAAYAFASEIENCSFEGCISTYAVTSIAYVGGILGFSASATNIIHCHNKGKIFSSSLNTAYGGGILADCDNGSPLIQYCCNDGYVYVTAYKYVYAGGIIARLNYNASIEGCFNAGIIETYSNSYAYTGGLVGLGNNCLINESYNDAAVYAVAYDYAYAGGIIGFTEHTSSISNVYNKGNVLSNSYYYKSYVGGIIGNVHNYSYMPTILKSCYNVGYLYSISSKTAFLGGICGEITINITINNAYCLQTPFFYPTNQSGKMVDCSFLCSQQAVDSLNQEDKVWLFDDALLNDGYPLLKNAGRSFVVTNPPIVQSMSVVLEGVAIRRSHAILKKGFAYKKHQDINFTYISIDSSHSFQTVLKDIVADTLYEYKAYIVLKTDTIFGASLFFKIGEMQVYTLAATALKANSALLNARIEYGENVVVSKGFKWKKVLDETDNYLMVDYACFSSKLFNLLSNTDYVCQAFVVTSLDTIYANSVYFKTQLQQSVVETNLATAISPYSAILSAYIQYGDDTIVKKGFEWKEESSYKTNIVYVNDTSFSFVLNDLSSNENYLYRSFIITTTDTIFGNELAFKTLRSCSLITHPATSVAMCAAVLNGHISVCDENVYMQGFLWRAVDDTSEQIIQNYGIDISDTLYELSPQTNYVYCVFLITNNGVFYGNLEYFTTLNYSFKVTTIEASDIGATTAVLHGQVVYGKENVLMQGFEYKEKSSENYMIVKVDGNNMVDTLNNLKPLTDYQFRAFVMIAQGVVYGETLSFSTLEDTKINEIITNNPLCFYPNPVEDKLYLVFDNDSLINAKLEIVDMYGKSYYHQLLTSKNMLINLDKFPKGFYILTVKKDSLIQQSYKFIKK